MAGGRRPRRSVAGWAIPLFIATMSFIQWRLDKRKERRKAASKARAARADMRGGW